MLTRFRFWMIGKLAGKDLIMLNTRVCGERLSTSPLYEDAGVMVVNCEYLNDGNPPVYETYESYEALVNSLHRAGFR